MVFGGGPEDVYLVQDTGTGYSKPVGGAQALFYTDAAKQNRITDLQTTGGQGIQFVTTENGGSGATWATGQIAPFLGPDGVFEMWVSVAGSPPFLMQASNLGSWAGPALGQLAQLLSAPSPALATLIDVDGTGVNSAPAGQALVKGSNGVWGPGTVASGGGGGGDATLAGAQTFSGAKTMAALLTLLGGGSVKPLSATAVGLIIQALASQSGNLVEWRNSAAGVLSWVGPNGNIYAPNLGQSIPLSKTGALANGTGTLKWVNDSGTSLVIMSARANLGTALGTGSAVFDPKVNGTSIYSVAGNRPTIPAAGTTSGKNTGFTNGSVIPDGGIVTVDITGTYTGGADCTFQLNVR